MRFFLLLLLFIPLFIFAEPAKVVGVIPVKFNSKGMHAPTPYSQQIMQRGYTRVPTLNLPFTFSGGGQFNPRYQPTKVSKNSLARALGKIAGRAAKMTPATKAMLIAYGAYEANCFSENYPSLCFDGPEEEGTSCVLGDAIPNVGCAVAAPSGKLWNATTGYLTTNKTFSHKDLAVAQKAACSWFLSASASGTTAGHRECTGGRSYRYKNCNWTTPPTGGGYCDYNGSWQYSTTNGGDYQDTDFKYYCPPESPQFEEFQTLLSAGVNSKCTKPFDMVIPQVPVDADWVEDKIDENPAPIADIGLDDFVDWETGLPYPEAFDNPTLDPVSDAFADAAEAVANGTVQHTNPTGKGYVPAEMMPNLLVQINNWHEGNSFIDIFNGKEVTPEAPPPEESNIDWSKFPGITKAQYDASNNAWGDSAVSGAPDINSELDKLTQEQQKLTDFINEPPPAIPFEFALLDFFALPTSNGCQGFTLTGSINGVSKPITVNQHCPPYDAWGRPVVSWLISIYTLLQCFQIFRRTLEVTP